MNALPSPSAPRYSAITILLYLRWRRCGTVANVNLCHYSTIFMLYLWHNATNNDTTTAMSKKNADTLPRLTIETCDNLQDIRNHIDALDEQIIPLLCERIQYITQAAQFKDSVADTRRFGRIEAILARAKAYANALGANEDYIESVYRHLIDESIRQEKAQWLAQHSTKPTDTGITD